VNFGNFTAELFTPHKSKEQELHFQEVEEECFLHPFCRGKLMNLACRFIPKDASLQEESLHFPAIISPQFHLSLFWL
jgi:hypothetical protein